MILNKSQLVYNITTELSDNATESITPYHVRHNLLDIIDSTAELLKSSNIQAKNIKTVDERTTILGDQAIERILSPNYSSKDNSAFGFSALRLNFRGERNTAVGSNSLRTNIYGNDNVGLGFESLAGNVTGSGNVAIGNFGLTANKTGDFNIAIGHGAGYYIDQDDSYQFYLGSSPVDSGVLCYDVNGDSFVPLMRGDLKLNRLGINTKELIGSAVLQTSGSITPVESNAFNIGGSGLLWNRIYSSNVYFSSTTKLSLADTLTFNVDITPESPSAYDLGSTASPIKQTYTDFLTVNNLAYINDAEFIHSSHYINKTLNLASRYESVQLDGGGPYSLYDYYGATEEDYAHAPFLTSEQLDGAGLIVHASGDISYELLLNTENADNKFWQSNISLVLPQSGYIQTSHINSNSALDFSINETNTTQLYLDDNHFYFGNRSFANNNDLGAGNINFVNNAENDKYIVSYLHPSSGTIQNRFFSRCIGPDNSSVEPYVGFALNAYDLNSSGYFSIESFNSGSRFRRPVNSLIINRDSNKILKLTDSNIPSLPSEALDIDVSGKAHIKLRSRSANATSGLDFATNTRNASIVLNNTLELYSQNTRALNISPTSIGIFSNTSGTNVFSVSIGDSVYKNTSIGMRHSDADPQSVAHYGALFTKQKIVGDTQSSALMFIDSSGNLFDVVRSQFNSTDGLLFINDTVTAGGKDSFANKKTHTSSHNAAFGFESCKAITSGSKNTVLGSQCGKSLEAGSNNIAIGYNILSANKNNNNNIYIGTNGLGSTVSSDFNFALGINDDLVLMKGTLGPNNANKALELPNDGKLLIRNSTNTESVKITSNSIEVLDIGGSNFPDTAFDIKFTGNATSILASFNHEDPPLSYTTNYANIAGPFVQVNGHIKVKGDICFKDGSTMSQSPQSQITNLQSTQNGISQTLSSLLIEGTANSVIKKPNNINSPISGTISTIDGQNVEIKNRDPNLTIKTGDYVIAIKIGSEYRPIWVSNEFNALVSF